MKSLMKKWDIIENILIEKLVFWGKGFARLKSDNPDIDGRVLMITWWAVPGAIVNLKLLKKRSSYFETQIVETIKTSPIEKQHPTNKYGMSGGWKWINIPYEEQLKIKELQVEEALHNLSKFQENLPFFSIQSSPIVDGYRNKVEFSFWKFLSKKYDIEQHFNVWFHKQWEFSKIEDMEWCILIDEVQNDIYREIKVFAKGFWLPVYDQMKQEWFFRHILIRRTYFADEIMLLLSFSPEYFDKFIKINKKETLEKIKVFLISLTHKYPLIKSIYFSHNPNKSDTCIGDLELIYGTPTIKETLLDLDFNISPTSFFQTNSPWAEKLYSIVLDFAHKDTLKDYIVLDLYGWTGTIWMIFAKHWAKHVTSVELVTSASKDGEANAKANKIEHMDFVNAKVEDFLGDYLKKWKKADLLIIDPPRTWMHPAALPEILKFNTKQIIYVSCNPATLARDLEYILQNSTYKIEKIQAMDMFPHTHHIETVVSLIKE